LDILLHFIVVFIRAIHMYVQLQSDNCLLKILIDWLYGNHNRLH